MILHSRILTYLDEVVRHGSIRKASERLHVAPSAISRQILTLEEQFGIPLFDRSGRRLTLTTAGELLIRHVRQTIRELDRTRAQIEELKGLRRGIVSIGLMSGLAADIVPRAVSEFHKRSPRVELKLRLMATGEEIVSAVDSGDVDLGFGFDLGRSPAIRVIHSSAARLGAVMAPDHRLASMPMLRLGDCAPFPIVIADKTTAIRPHIGKALDAIGLDLTTYIETNSIEIMRSLAINGTGITFLTPFDIEAERRSGRLVYVPVHELSQYVQHLTLIESSKRSNVLSNLFSQYIKGLLLGNYDAD